MIRWTCALVVDAVLSGFAFLLVTGRYINDGAVVVPLGPDHGIHIGDLFVLLGWSAAVVSTLLLTVLSGQSRTG